MEINRYSEPGKFHNPVEQDAANKNNPPSPQAVERKPPVKQTKIDSLKTDPKSSRARKETSLNTPSSNFHPIIKRSENSENDQANRRFSLLRPDSESKVISLINVNPKSISPAVQKKFKNLSERIKSVKENMPPEITRQASNFIRDTIKKNFNLDVDPDQIHVKSFSIGEVLHDGNDGITGWQHYKKDMKESKSLTEFVMGNFNDAWRAGTTNDLNFKFGLYRNNGNSEIYGANNEIKILPSDLRRFIKEGDLEKHLAENQKLFWDEQAPKWRALAKTEFSGLAKKALLDGELTQKGYELAMKGAASDVPLSTPAKFSQMRSEASSERSVQIHRFDINGYSATDIPRFSGEDGRQVLYISGEEQPFYEFNNDGELKNWVIEQAKNNSARQELARHFSIYDRSRGNWGPFSATGVDEGLSNLASRTWNQSRIDTQAETIHGDVFTDMAERTRWRNEDDLLQIAKGNDKREIWLKDLEKSDSAPFSRPIARVLSAGNFATSVGAEGGEAFVAGTRDARQSVKEAAGMNVALTLLFAPSARSSMPKPQTAQSSGSSISDSPVDSTKQSSESTISDPLINSRKQLPVPSAPDASIDLTKQSKFNTTDFPDRNAADAVNEINEKMQEITGRNNLRQFHSLSDLKKASDGGAHDGLNLKRITNSLEEVYQRLNNANSRFHDPKAKGDVLKALEKSLGTTDENALTQAYDRLKNLSFEAFERFKSNRTEDYNKITFFDRLDKDQPFPDAERNTPVSAFINMKDRSRIMLNLEGPDEGRYKFSQTEAGRRYNAELVDSIMSHVTRISDNTQGFVDVEKQETKDGFSLSSAKKALEQFVLGRPNDALCRRVLGKDPGYPDDSGVLNILGITGDHPVSEHMRATAKYKYNGMTDGERKKYSDSINMTYADKERADVLDKIRKDNVLRADLMTSNADTAAIYLRDIAACRNYDTPPSFDYFLSLAKEKAPAYATEEGVQRLANKLLKIEGVGGTYQFQHYQGDKKTSGYSVEDADGKLHVFPTEAEAQKFWNDNVFWRAVGKKLENPLGTIMETIAGAAGASPKLQKELYDIGDNPFGKSWALVAKHAGASEGVQDAIKQSGKVAEGFIPYWGQARYYSDLSGRAAQGKSISPEELIDAATDLKDILSGNIGGGVKRKEKSDSGTDKLPTEKGPKVQNSKKNGAPDIKAAISERSRDVKLQEAKGKAIRKKIGFRENRGGEALASTAYFYKKFDYSDFLKNNSDEISHGVALEVMARMDRKSGGVIPAANKLRKYLKKSNPFRDTIVGIIKYKQDNPDQVRLKKYRQNSSKHYGGDRQKAISETESDAHQLKENDVALLKMGIKDKDGNMLENGPVLLEKHLRGQQYQIFDPSSGVFLYQTANSSQKAVGNYLNTAYRDKGELYPETFTTYKYEPGSRPELDAANGAPPQGSGSRVGAKNSVAPNAFDAQRPRYQTESRQGTGSDRDSTTQGGPSGTDPSGFTRTTGTSEAQRPFGENYDFRYIDAEDVPNPQAITPSAGSVEARDLRIRKAGVPDPKSAGYSGHLDGLVSKAKTETGIVGNDLLGLQKVAYQYNTIIGIRPVDQFATGLIESGYETKGFHVKGKSASWGPQAGLIAVDQHFSKLENSKPERIAKFNAEVEKSIQNRDAVKVPLELSPNRLETLAKMGVISAMSTADSNGVRTFTAPAPSGKEYRFEATPGKNADEELFSITSEHKPIEVLAPTTPGAKPLTADYDLMVVGPHMSDVGPQDNLPVPDVSQSVFKKRVDGYQNSSGINPNLKGAYDDPKIFYQREDPDIGNATERIRNLIPVLNNEVMLEAGTPRARVVHHNADSGSPAADPAANYPATFALPFKMGKFDEIAIIHNKDEFKELVQLAKDNGYQFPLNPLWEDEVKGVRRTGFTNSRNERLGQVQVTPSSNGQGISGSSGMAAVQQPFGQTHDFRYIDAEEVPNRQAITPSAGSLEERDHRIQETHVPDPKSTSYPAYLDELVSRMKGETGVVSDDLAKLQKISYEYNTIIGVRPVDRLATGLIETGYETKGFHVKGKSASWGPQAGLIAVDQRFSKLENASSERISRFNAEINKSIENHDAIKVPLELSPGRLDALAKMGIVSEMSNPDSNGFRTFTAVAPSGKVYSFEATPGKKGSEDLFAITHEHKPVEVLAPTAPGAKPLTADYDLLVVGPHMSDVGPHDKLPTPDVSHGVFRKRVDGYGNQSGINPNLREAYDDKNIFHQHDDPDIGNATERVRNLIPVINNAVMLEANTSRAKAVHHADDSGNPVTDPAANYPATFVLPFKMGKFGEIAVVRNENEFQELVQVAKDSGYHVPLSPLWEDGVKNVRRTGFTDAKNSGVGQAESSRRRRDLTDSQTGRGMVSIRSSPIRMTSDNNIKVWIA